MSKLLLITLVTALFLYGGHLLFCQQGTQLLEQQYRPTQFEYQECHRALRCKDMKCPQTDKKCQSDAWFYDDCQKKNQVCVRSWQDYETMASDDSMSENYYQCNAICGPKNGVSAPEFWEIYKCEATCGGIMN